MQFLPQTEVPGMLNEMKTLISNQEMARMGQTGHVTQRLLSLIDTVSSSKFGSNHEQCEILRKKLQQQLAESQEQIRKLNEQSSSHVCWTGQPPVKYIEDLKM